MRRGGSVSVVFAVLAALCLKVPLHLAAATSNRQTDLVHTSGGDLSLTPVYHGSVMLEFGGRIIHVDPWSMADCTGLPPADLIVVTHTHADHHRGSKTEEFAEAVKSTGIEVRLRKLEGEP